MRTLIIEVSTERGALAIGEDSEILMSKELPFGLQQSSQLMPSLENLLKETSCSLKEIDVLAIGIGPGSYTGIRVGAAIAKTLAYAIQLPLVGFCSLCAFLPDDEGPFAALIDAKISGAYILKGVKNQHGICYNTLPTAVPLENLSEPLKEISQLITPNQKNLKEKLSVLYPEASWKWQEKSPDISHLLKIVRHKFETGQIDTPNSLELLYLRKTQAEISH